MATPKHLPSRIRSQAAVAILATVAFSRPASADEGDKEVQFFFEPGLTTTGTSNVFLDKSEEWDLALQPAAELGLNFARVWTVDYKGELNAYVNHRSLLSHWHGLSLFANPAWGEEGQHQLVVEVSGETLRNMRDYAEINIVRPGLRIMLEMEPAHFFRWRVSTELSYRLFYDDRPSDSVDSWTRARGTFTLPSRTTLSPRVGYGFRYYPLQDEAVSSDDKDHQVEVGLHASQALWEKGGLQLDYAYLRAIGDAGMLERKLTLEQFTYLDTDFLYSGHQAMLGFRQLLGQSWSLMESVRFEERAYAGWVAVDDAGEAKDEDRRDLQLIPRALVEYTWASKKQEDGVSRFGFGVNLSYQYTRQWSSSYWYDTSAHVGILSLWGSL